MPWWRERWRSELVPKAAIIVAEQSSALVGFVTIDIHAYLDQLVVAPGLWGSKLADALVDEAKRLSPDSITLLVNQDNAPRDSLLPTQWLRSRRTRRQPDVGPAGIEDGMEALMGPHTPSNCNRASRA